jgi:putative DNA primase/helicase
MRNIPIAYGSSCFAKSWSNNTITFDELCSRLSETFRTTETMEEYRKLSKTERTRAKDKGGFVGGQLRDNRRKRETIVSRSMLTLDADHAEIELLESFKVKCAYAACLYTTHSHTTKKPRVRIIVPLSRDVSSDEYTAIARLFTDDLGIDQFDECSYRPHQLMYWPTTPSDGDFVFKRPEGPWLDPDEYLSSYPEWKDPTKLPSTKRERTLRSKTKSKQQDPHEKPRIVGAFCRRFTIQEAIEKYLSDIYEPSAVEGRYDYIPADSAAGVVIYDDKFSYSHHASDPACDQLLNAFDLVRIHRFGDDDKKKTFHEMKYLASNDVEVKRFMIDERCQEAFKDFTITREDWKDHLVFDGKSDVLKNSVWNLNLIIHNDPDFAHFAFNELAGRVQVTGKLPWTRPEGNSFWRDADTAQLKSLLDTRYTPFSQRNYDVAFTKAADDRRFHPIRDYLNRLPKWDGVKRVEELFIRYLEADDTPYVRAATRKSFAAAVARIYRPGTKFDSVLVLDGNQGIGKSTIVKDLISSEYYCETLSLIDMNDKSGAEKLQGFWVVEIGELAGMRKADIERVKAFLSTADDKYRPSYGRTVESHPRQCVIIATVNGERGFLRDITGNRRFWVVKARQVEPKRNWSFDEAFRDQFWAEAKMLWEAGEQLYLEDEFLKEADQAQRAAMESDDRLGMVEDYLIKLLPENWVTLNLHERRDFLTDPDSLFAGKGKNPREVVSNAEVWCECFERNLSDLTKADSYRIAALMMKVPGWARTQEIKRQSPYGKQRIYRKFE